MGTRRVSWPNKTANSIAPTAITANTKMPIVPAPASTAGMVKTPVPTMLPTTSPVADVKPRARDLSWSRGELAAVGGDSPAPLTFGLGSAPTNWFIWLTFDLGWVRRPLRCLRNELESM
ncbi:hypothetical protein MHEL_40690 [Mycolicibacterium helvum]|uniref:Uncharacterized protein n=1 Tax=Mycolicibacterium helvum TaxID=1534349 RepID=A0A7I7TCE2_9MYCO|nr:hypothetical protein MHEL_40690 [Mycolicibacterium helvum]